MKIYAIADLHLAISVEDKNMDLFGATWAGYMERLAENWRSTCTDDDIVVVPGDISWAMQLEKMEADFSYLKALPGKKLLMKGNHDYWWSTAAKLEKCRLQWDLSDVFFIHNNCYMAGEIAICGTRGWLMPGDKKFKQEDMLIYKREYQRLERSLQEAAEKGAAYIIGALHYPPFSLKAEEPQEFVELLQRYGVKQCVFGHIHNASGQFPLWEARARELSDQTGILFSMVSADYLDFQPILLLDSCVQA